MLTEFLCSSLTIKLITIYNKHSTGKKVTLMPNSWMSDVSSTELNKK